MSQPAVSLSPTPSLTQVSLPAHIAERTKTEVHEEFDGVMVGMAEGTQRWRLQYDRAMASKDAQIHGMHSELRILRGRVEELAEWKEESAPHIRQIACGNAPRAGELERSHLRLTALERHTAEQNRRLSRLAGQFGGWRLSPGGSVNDVGDGSEIPALTAAPSFLDAAASMNVASDGTVVVMDEEANQLTQRLQQLEDLVETLLLDREKQQQQQQQQHLVAGVTEGTPPSADANVVATGAFPNNP